MDHLFSREKKIVFDCILAEYNEQKKKGQFTKGLSTSIIAHVQDKSHLKTSQLCKKNSKDY